jgi:hypothetical protein
MLFSLRGWIAKVFGRDMPVMSDAMVKREYVLTGWDFATAVSQVTVAEPRNKDTLLMAWEIAEKRYSDRGFRTIPLDDFVRYATLGVPLRGVGAVRDLNEIVILHAPYYRLYHWKLRPTTDLFTTMRDEGYLVQEDFTRAYARHMKS